MKSRLLAALICLAALPVDAGPAEDLAQRRIGMIAEGNVGAVVAQYADDARLVWVGGPLDGTYGAHELSDVWSRFAAARGVQTVEIQSLTEAANPDGATIVAELILKGTSDLPVRYIMVFRGESLTDEIWQVNTPRN